MSNKEEKCSRIKGTEVLKNTYNISSIAYEVMKKHADNANITVPEFLNMVIVDYFSESNYDKDLYDVLYTDIKTYFLNLPDYELLGVYINYTEVFNNYEYRYVKDDMNADFVKVDNCIDKLLYDAGYGKVESRRAKSVIRFYRYEIIKDIFKELSNDKDIKNKLKKSKTEVDRMSKLVENFMD